MDGGMDARPDDPKARGIWEPISSCFHHLPVHLALLRTGRVLAFGGSGNKPPFLGQPFPAEVWDPKKGGDAQPINQGLDGDVFCSGHAFLPDGRLVVAGGTRRYDWQVRGVGVIPFRGLDQSYVFDPGTERWARMPDLARGRWYPTLVSLPDGSALAMAGLSKYFPWYFRRSAEVFTPPGRWQTKHSAGRWLPLYPRLHVVPAAGGRPAGVFYAGAFNTHVVYPFRLKSFPTALLDLEDWKWRPLGVPMNPQREEGATILLPLKPPEYRPRVLLLGGGNFRGASLAHQAEIIDLGATRPAWRGLTSAPLRDRYYAYSVILPDGKVLVAGGRVGRGTHGHGAEPPHPGHPHEPPMPKDPGPCSPSPPTQHEAIHDAELFDPEHETWHPVASMRKDRVYHSNLMLLPDARVIAVGSNPERGSDELSIEIYQPPYLFGGPRPVIQAAPEAIQYGGAFEIESPNAETITEATLIRPTATTHCVNTEQRYVGLILEAVRPSRLRLTAPSDRFVAPPGYYMLFVLREGVPSKAWFLRLG